jgi:hypothetical protein
MAPPPLPPRQAKATAATTTTTAVAGAKSRSTVEKKQKPPTATRSRKNPTSTSKTATKRSQKTEAVAKTTVVAADGATTNESELWSRLVPYWDAHQKHHEKTRADCGVSNSLALSRSVASILNAKQAYSLERSTQALSLERKERAQPNIVCEKEEEIESEWSTCLHKFVDCAMVAIATTTTSNTAESAAHAVLRLTVAVAVAAADTAADTANANSLEATTRTNATTLDALVAHWMRYSSDCPVDAVRAAATVALGWVAAAAIQQSVPTAAANQDHHHHHESAAWTLHLARLDALQQAILPRLTDTAVCVRAAAVTAIYGHNDTNDQEKNPLATDPDLRQGVVWVLQHDSSPTNRALAASVLPVSLQTLDRLVSRVGDTKAAVRVAALDAVRRGASLASRTNDSAYDQGSAAFGHGPEESKREDEDDNAVDKEHVSSFRPMWQPHYMAQVLTTGLSDRYETIAQVCARWCAKNAGKKHCRLSYTHNTNWITLTTQLPGHQARHASLDSSLDSKRTVRSTALVAMSARGGPRGRGPGLDSSLARNGGGGDWRCQCGR